MTLALPYPDPHVSVLRLAPSADLRLKVQMETMEQVGMEWSDPAYWFVREIPLEQIPKTDTITAPFPLGQ